VEQVVTLNRKKEFKESVFKPLTVNDSRFGIRKMFLNTKEKPSIAGYSAPGKGVSGEHQN
jgi:hypothetical protein